MLFVSENANIEAYILLVLSIKVCVYLEKCFQCFIFGSSFFYALYFQQLIYGLFLGSLSVISCNIVSVVCPIGC